MTEAIVRVPPDSTGARLRMRSRIIGGETVMEQAVFQGALPTYYAVADTVAFATNKHHISIFNSSASQIIAIRKLFAINLQLSAVTGVTLRFNAHRTTAQSGGTAITPVSADTNNGALSGVTVATGATCTNGGLLYPFTTSNDEITAANTAVANFLTQYNSLAVVDSEVQELRLRENEGFTIQQITASSASTSPVR